MIDFIYQLPVQSLSRWVGKLTHIRCRWFKNTFIRCFIRFYKIDLGDLQRQDINEYQHFNDFFTRELAPGTRSTQILPDKIISPVDGIVSELGAVTAGKLIQAKKIYYDATTLLGGNAADSAPFYQGQFITSYLAPYNYHRVHMPIAGSLDKMIYIPGELFTLGPRAVQRIPQLFSRNERVVCFFSTAVGPLAIVLVGALFVDSISTEWHGIVNTNQCRQIQSWQYPKNSIQLQQHQQLGQFQYGSTVILLFPQHSITWLNNLAPKQPLKVGEVIGELQTVEDQVMV